MADKNTRRISAQLVQQDLDSFTAFEAITGYAPANQQYTTAKVTAASQAMSTAQKEETRLAAALAAARDNACAAEWAFHDLMLGVKDQVRAQFGPSSNEWQALGQKKKSEFKRPTGRKATKPAA